MRLRHHHQVRLAQELDLLVAHRRGGDVVLHDHLHVRGSLPRELHQAQVQPQLRELADERGHHRRDPRRTGRGEVADGEGADPAGAEVTDHPVDLGQPLEDRPQLVGERRAGRRGHDPPAAPLDEHQPGLALQRAEVLADRGGGVAECGGGTAHGPGGDDGPEDAEPVDVQHAANSTALLKGREEMFACAEAFAPGESGA